MQGKVQTTTVKGQTYKFWSDFSYRCTFAENEQGEVKRLSSSGYISNDLTVRKAIMCAFHLDSFKK